MGPEKPGTEVVPVINKSSELKDSADKWLFDEDYEVWCLEDVLYTQKATTPKFQRLSIFVPAVYLNADGSINPSGRCNTYTAATAPVIFENNAAGYMQMPHTWLGGPRDEAPKYLERGMVYISCGCRGRESVNADGVRCGKSPWTLVDLKTAIRFIRHNKAVLPGDMDKIISVGWSAGGAMSSLVSITGDHPDYLPYLKENGAFMEESDAVFAGEIYCPITDLDHADLAYEWQFHKDPENEDSPAGPAGTFTPFRAALSGILAREYIAYFNSLGLTHPISGVPLVLGEDGRSGSAYEYLMDCLDASATKFLHKLDAGELEARYSASDYLSGNYVAVVDAPPAPPAAPDTDEPPRESPTHGDMLCRPPKGVPYIPMDLPKIQVPGKNKTSWLTWDGVSAHIKDLDTYTLKHRRRMKPCSAFDTLGCDSGENQEFGTPERDYLHFDTYMAGALDELKDRFPEEYKTLYPGYAAALGDQDLELRKHLINPLRYLDPTALAAEKSAHYYRINTGAGDADTAFIVSMLLAVKLENLGKDVEYQLVWDKPHCEADYPGEVLEWVERICR